MAFVPGTGGTNAAKTFGILNIRGGIVLANRIIVGAASTNNNSITLNSGTLVVTNGVGSLSSRPTTFAITNSLLRLNITGITNIFCTNLVSGPLTTTTNYITLDSVSVFASYPKQLTLIKYASQVGAGTTNFFLLGIPASAPGAYLSNNVANNSLDLVLPYDPRPVITAQPNSYSGNPGDNVAFNVALSGNSATPLAYQWYRVASPLSDGVTGSGSTIAGSTTASLAINNAQPGDNASYTVIITNAYGSATSAPPAVLTISAGNIAPSLTGPNNITVIQGNNATFSASASGNPAPALQWQRNGVNITGQTSSSYTVTNAQYPADDGALFSLIATNAAGSVTNSATITVIVPPAISGQPVSLIVTNTQAASFSVTASGVPAPTYQWSFNNTPISGATNATYNLASATSANIGTYKAVLNNAAGSATSSNAILIVNSTMSATSFSPSNGAAGICYDTPLAVTFSAAPTLRLAGKIKIFNITNNTTPVDTIDMSLGSPQSRNVGGDAFNTYPITISGSMASIYPHAGVLKSNATYYVTIDNGVFADATGAYFAGISATNVWQFATKVGGSANPTNLVVNVDGTDDFLTVQGAVDSIASGNTTPTTINIRNGNYVEIINVKSRHNLDFRGQTRIGTVIGYPNNDLLNPGAPLRSSFVLNANDCALENLTLTNRTPKGGSQAEAIDIEGTRSILFNMDLDSYQDTFLVHSAGKLVYLQDSLIQGDTDFNWGYGTVYYTNCEIRAMSSGAHVTQPRSPAGSNGFAFVNCRITKGFPSGTFDLGRTIGTPSSPSEVLFAGCLMDDAITGYASDAGTSMSDYACSNLTATAAKSLAFSTHLTSSDPFVIAAQSAVTWLYGWQPQVAPNILTQPINQTTNVSNNISFAVVATGLPNANYQWFKGATPIIGATGATLTLTNVQFSNAGFYSVVVSNSSGSVTSDNATLTVPNRSPVAAVLNISRPAGLSLNLTLANLATNWSDADGDTLTLNGINLVTTNGVTLATNGTTITYPNSANVNDRFTYTINDGQGGTGTGVVNVVINNSIIATNSISRLTIGTTNLLTAAGLPGYTYILERATNLAPAIWLNISTNVAATNGIINAMDNFSDVGGVPPGSAFYRFQWLP